MMARPSASTVVRTGDCWIRSPVPRVASTPRWFSEMNARAASRSMGLSLRRELAEAVLDRVGVARGVRDALPHLVRLLDLVLDVRRQPSAGWTRGAEVLEPRPVGLSPVGDRCPVRRRGVEQPALLAGLDQIRLERCIDD